jgi:hypothetical protein
VTLGIGCAADEGGVSGEEQANLLGNLGYNPGPRKSFVGGPKSIFRTPPKCLTLCPVSSYPPRRYELASIGSRGRSFHILVACSVPRAAGGFQPTLGGRPDFEPPFSWG